MLDLHCLLDLDKVAIGTCNLVFVISNFAEFLALDKMQSSVQLSSRWTLQFISGISNDLQKLLKYFNGTTVFVFFTKLFVLSLSTSAVLPTRAALYLNYWELLIVKSALSTETSSLLNYHKLPNVSE